MITEKLNGMLDFVIMPDEGSHCIYKLIDSNEVVVYIGQTANLESRLYTHLTNGRDFSFFEYELCDKEDASITESKAIIKHNPILNTSLPKSPNYKTIDQARKLIRCQLAEFVQEETERQIALIDVLFSRPQVKNMKYTYLRTVDIELAIERIKLSEFIALGEE